MGLKSASGSTFWVGSFCSSRCCIIPWPCADTLYPTSGTKTPNYGANKCPSEQSTSGTSKYLSSDQDTDNDCYSCCVSSKHQTNVPSDLLLRTTGLQCEYNLKAIQEYHVFTSGMHRLNTVTQQFYKTSACTGRLRMGYSREWIIIILMTKIN